MKPPSPEILKSWRDIILESARAFDNVAQTDSSLEVRSTARLRALALAKVAEYIGERLGSARVHRYGAVGFSVETENNHIHFVAFDHDAGDGVAVDLFADEATELARSLLLEAARHRAMLAGTQQPESEQP